MECLTDNENKEQLPSISQALTMIHQLHLLSTKQYPELHALIMQLQSNLIDVYLDTSTSKQRYIRDFFKPIYWNLVIILEFDMTI